MHNGKSVGKDTISIIKKDCLESIAQSVHDTWVAGRTKEGWKYGKIRDEINKEHPSLIPYDRLPESEKDYDRKTAMTTIRWLSDHRFLRSGK
ncbi:MAG: hypothetical protein AUK31_01650 [Fibrobacteres bacterium CG2_30_45_31]|nr:MAG: hypothetical protein AUK31_01650 [Fibrobacteres bacterium CG2_30_45_31]